MSVPSYSARHAWLSRPFALPTLMLWFALGCANATKSADDSMVSGALPPGGDVLDPLNPGERLEDSPPATPSGLRGELPHDTTFYKAHPDEFYQLMLPMGWHGHRRKRKCKDQVGSSDCQTNKKQGEMVVEAIQDAHKVKVDVQTTNPVVIGRVINTGGREDALLPVAPAQPNSPPDQYYFIVERGTATQAKLMVAQLQLSSDSKTAISMVIHLAPNGFVKCTHLDADPPRTQGTADFRSCSRRHGPERRSRHSDEDERRWRFDTAIDLAWFSCDGGCCSAQWPP